MVSPMRVRLGNMLGKGCRVGRIAASVVRRARAVPLGIKHDLRRVGGLCAPNGTRTQAYQTPPKSAAAGGRQLNYCCQSTAAATEASLGAFGGSKARWVEKIFSVKKKGIWGHNCGPPYAHFFNENIFFRPSWILHCQEQPKRPPNPPRLASIAAAVRWQHSFHGRPLTAPPAWRSREALVYWCGSVHTAHRPAVGRVLCPGVLPGPV